MLPYLSRIGVISADDLLPTVSLAGNTIEYDVVSDDEDGFDGVLKDDMITNEQAELLREIQRKKWEQIRERTRQKQLAELQRLEKCQRDSVERIEALELQRLEDEAEEVQWLREQDDQWRRGLEERQRQHQRLLEEESRREQREKEEAADQQLGAEWNAEQQPRQKAETETQAKLRDAAELQLQMQVEKLKRLAAQFEKSQELKRKRSLEDREARKRHKIPGIATKDFALDGPLPGPEAETKPAREGLPGLQESPAIKEDPESKAGQKGLMESPGIKEDPTKKPHLTSATLYGGRDPTGKFDPSVSFMVKFDAHDPGVERRGGHRFEFDPTKPGDLAASVWGVGHEADSANPSAAAEGGESSTEKTKTPHRP